MTEHDQASDGMTRAEYIATIARVYDVPMTLIRYVDTFNASTTNQEPLLKQ